MEVIKEQKKMTILMFPWLAFSHILPFFELSKKLASRDFHIYFCSSSVNLDLIKKKLKNQEIFDDSSIQLVQLQIPSSPEFPPQFHTTKNLPPNLKIHLYEAIRDSKSCFSDILNTLKPDLLVYDFFQPWAPELAASQGIASVYFATAAAMVFGFFHHQFSYGSSRSFPFEEIYQLDHEKIKQGDKVAYEKIFKDADKEHFGFGNFWLSSEIVLVKGSKVVEEKYMEYLSVLCEKRVVPTGLLVHMQESDENEENSNLLEWLCKKDQFSTLFICFGSEHFMSKDQIQEMANGLELCGVNFIWVIKFSDGDDEKITLEDAFPQGFLEKIKGRGLVIEGWVPQATILSSSKIGAFLSHCGWSSVTESLYFGVPIIALPVKHDQPLNARFVKDIGVGVEIVKDENGRFSGEEVAGTIREVFMEMKGKDLRERARELSAKIKEEEEKTMDEAAEEILKVCLKNKV